MLPEKWRAEAFLSRVRAARWRPARIPTFGPHKQRHYMSDLFSLDGEKWSSVL
jgi:hypothetical protein